LSQWFGEYVNAFVACGRGESETASLLAYYGVPLLLTTDDGFLALTTGDQVVAAVQQLVDALRAAGYARSEIHDSGGAVLNSTSALYHQTFSRYSSDGSEISRGIASYVVTRARQAAAFHCWRCIVGRDWPGDLAGLLWIANQLPFGLTARPNPAAQRQLPPALVSSA
jgi:hypothetical protein